MGQDIRELLSEVAGTSISGRRRVPRYRHSLIWLPAYRLKHPPQRAVAQRLCALARFSRPGRVTARRLLEVFLPRVQLGGAAEIGPISAAPTDNRRDGLPLNWRRVPYGRA